MEHRQPQRPYRDEPDGRALRQHELLALEEYRQQLDLENHIRHCQCSCNHLGYGNYWSYKVSRARATRRPSFRPVPIEDAVGRRGSGL